MDHHLLSNRVYVGETVHKDKVYPGQHKAIVDRDLFDAVQAKLADRTNPTLTPGTRRPVSLLAGMIWDDYGRPMSPAHTRNHGRRYSYYASNPNDGSREEVLRLPAGELDVAVKAELRAFLTDPHGIRELVPSADAHFQVELAGLFTLLAGQTDGMAVSEMRRLLQRIGFSVTVSRESARCDFDASAIAAWGGMAMHDPRSVAFEIRTEIVSWGHERRLRLDPPAGRRETTDSNLIQLVARGFAARDELLAMSAEQVAATPITTLRHTERIARLAYLAPDIVRAILDGQQPKRVTARSLSRLGSLPLCWTEQRAMLGFEAR